jgi:hypothetical protein
MLQTENNKYSSTPFPVTLLLFLSFSMLNRYLFTRCNFTLLFRFLGPDKFIHKRIDPGSALCTADSDYIHYSSAC